MRGIVSGLVSVVSLPVYGAMVAALLSCGSAWATTAESAEELVRNATNRVLRELSSDESLLSDRPRLFQFVNENVAPHFDCQRMSRRVLGRHWSKATGDQREGFIAAFRNLLVRTYATALAGYKDQSIDVLPGRLRHGGAEATVRMTITRSGSLPLPITYEMGHAENTWKIYDLSIDGVSLVITYRTSFAAEVRKGGMDGLIKRLKVHNEGGA